jgi:prevent-host-death family protein
MHINALQKPALVLTGHFYMTIIVLKNARGIMKTAAISEIKAKLSDFLNQVKAGEEVLITDRGKPVARLSPLAKTRSSGTSLLLLEKQGLIRLGSGKLPKNIGTLPRAKDDAGLVLKALLEEREAGR